MNTTEYLKHIDDVIGRGRFKADWDSLKDFEIPVWYKDAKFGIFIHWGLYSVPAFNNEWYSRNMYIRGMEEFDYHERTFGPHVRFGYKDFIPLFTAPRFDAGEWMDMFVRAGAKYVMPVAEHHDGFQMYKSGVSAYNAFEMGPKRDIVGELFEAAKARNVVPCASSHRFEHWWFMGHGREFSSDITARQKRGDFYWPAEEEPAELFDIYSPPASREFMEDWLVRCAELIDNYRPRVLYFDWWIQKRELKPYLKKFIAYYYNKGIEYGFPAAVNYKFDALPYGAGVMDVERGQFASIKPELWQSCTSAAKNSWCYTAQNVWKTSKEIICDLVDVVSKNGCMLLNIGPKADGTICGEEKRILSDIGDWLRTNGEAVYGSRYFKVFGEGPLKIEEGQFTDGVTKEYTPEDIRFTRNGSKLYVFSLKYPDDGVLRIRSLGSKAGVFNGDIKSARALGFPVSPAIEKNTDALILTAPGIKSDLPVVFELLTD